MKYVYGIFKRKSNCFKSVLPTYHFDGRVRGLVHSLGPAITLNERLKSASTEGFSGGQESGGVPWSAIS